MRSQRLHQACDASFLKQQRDIVFACPDERVQDPARVLLDLGAVCVSLHDLAQQWNAIRLQKGQLSFLTLNQAVDDAAPNVDQAITAQHKLAGALAA